MMRLILFVFLIAAMLFVATSVMAVLLVTARNPSKAQGDTMPKTFQTVAYVLLIVLMFGVVSGWLGAA